MSGQSKPDAGTEARRLAIEAVRRIDEEGAYANLLLPTLLERSDLDQRDRNLVTELVYGVDLVRAQLRVAVEQGTARYRRNHDARTDDPAHMLTTLTATPPPPPGRHRAC